MTDTPTQPTEAEALCERLDITNADHIAMWLEHWCSPMPEQISFLAVQIAEAHEALIRQQQAEIERLREALARCLPRNVCLTNRNVPDSMIVPLEVTMGELRKVAALALTATALRARAAEKGPTDAN